MHNDPAHPVSIRLPDSVRRALRMEAAKHDRSMTEQLRVYLAEGLRRSGVDVPADLLTVRS